MKGIKSCKRGKQGKKRKGSWYTFRLINELRHICRPFTKYIFICWALLHSSVCECKWFLSASTGEVTENRHWARRQTKHSYGALTSHFLCVHTITLVCITLLLNRCPVHTITYISIRYQYRDGGRYEGALLTSPVCEVNVHAMGQDYLQTVPTTLRHTKMKSEKYTSQRGEAMWGTKATLST